MAAPNFEERIIPQPQYVLEALGPNAAFMGRLVLPSLVSGEVISSRKIADFMDYSGAENVRPVCLDTPEVPDNNVFRLADGAVEIDMNLNQLRVSGDPRKLRPQAYDLLAYLAHPERVDRLQSRGSILRHVFGYPEKMDKKLAQAARENLRVHTHLVRKALGPELGDPDEGVVQTILKRGLLARSSRLRQRRAN